MVEEQHLVSAWVTGGPPVLGTPMLVALCEDSARQSVDPLLSKDQQTVGTWIGLRHLAPTLPGMRVTARSELVQVEGRRLRFRIEAWDDEERVGEADHERFVVDVERFKNGLEEKAQRYHEKTQRGKE
jgi:predicted thioesterase